MNGWHDADTRRLVPVADWGDEQGYVRGIEVFTNDRPEGRGPAGIAFVEGRPYIANDFAGNPATGPWRERAERHGFRASTVFPIRMNGSACGVLCMPARWGSSRPGRSPCSKRRPAMSHLP